MPTRYVAQIVIWTALCTSLVWISFLAPHPFDYVASAALFVGVIWRLRRYAHYRSVNRRT